MPKKIYVVTLTVAERSSLQALIAAACPKPPEGRKSGTLKLLAHRLVELELVDSVSYETVRRTLY